MLTYDIMGKVAYRWAIISVRIIIAMGLLIISSVDISKEKIINDFSFFFLILKRIISIGNLIKNDKDIIS